MLFLLDIIMQTLFNIIRFIAQRFYISRSLTFWEADWTSGTPEFLSVISVNFYYPCCNCSFIAYFLHFQSVSLTFSYPPLCAGWWVPWEYEKKECSQTSVLEHTSICCQKREIYTTYRSGFLILQKGKNDVTA